VKAAKALAVLAMLAYPFLVYGGLRFLEPRRLAMALGGVLLLREVVRSRSGSASPLLLPLVLVAAILGLAAVFNEGRFFLFVPVLINAALLVSFARTLRTGPSLVERFARRRRPHLPAEDVAYCRRVTIMWCGFFIANGGVILWLALRSPLEHWTLYTGLIAYVLMGVLTAAELAYRAWRFRRYEGDVTDVFLRKIFPPKSVG
jgi:uncharacterized membrane protein